MSDPPPPDVFTITRTPNHLAPIVFTGAVPADVWTDAFAGNVPLDDYLIGPGNWTAIPDTALAANTTLHANPLMAPCTVNMQAGAMLHLNTATVLHDFIIIGIDACVGVVDGDPLAVGLSANAMQFSSPADCISSVNAWAGTGTLDFTNCAFDNGPTNNANDIIAPLAGTWTVTLDSCTITQLGFTQFGGLDSVGLEISGTSTAVLTNCTVQVDAAAAPFIQSSALAANNEAVITMIGGTLIRGNGHIAPPLGWPLYSVSARDDSAINLTGVALIQYLADPASTGLITIT